MLSSSRSAGRAASLEAAVAANEAENVFWPLYRAMRAGPDGLPEVDRSSSTLGVRTGGIQVDLGDVARPKAGGMSVVLDDPRSLPLGEGLKAEGGRMRTAFFILHPSALIPACAC
jgi:hypothetical protein